VKCQHYAPAALPPGKTRYRLYRRLGGPQGWSGRLRKISPPPRFDTRTVQLVASRYTELSRPTRYSIPHCNSDFKNNVNTSENNILDEDTSCTFFWFRTSPCVYSTVIPRLTSDPDNEFFG